MKKTILYITLLLLGTSGLRAQNAMNRPYSDDKLLHFGFSLGLNFMSYSALETLTPVSGMLDNGRTFENEVLHARTSHLLPGFSVGFIGDLRLCEYLNLRFTPELHFGQRTLTYTSESENLKNVTTELLSLPVTIPLNIKWSAMREGNYRPYLVAGGGVSYDFGQDKEKHLVQQPFDYFVQVGAGCDFYLSWFKFCPEIKYQIGFNNVLVPTAERPELPGPFAFYTDAVKQLHSHVITLVFNFE